MTQMGYVIHWTRTLSRFVTISEEWGRKLGCAAEPCQVLIFSGCDSHPAAGSLQPVATEATRETNPSEPSRDECVAIGDAAGRQAVIASER